MITQFETFTNTAPRGWDDMVCQLDGSIFHSTLWAEYQRMTTGAQPMFLLARNAEGKACTGALAFFQQSHRPLASVFLRNLQLFAHPCGRDCNGSVVAHFMRQCEVWAQELGCARLTLGSFMSSDSLFVPLEHSYTETQRLEFSLDLSHDTESLWRGIRKDQRERIRRLEREGVVVEMDATREGVRGLQAVREATQAKRAQQGLGYELSADEAFYGRLYEHLVQRGAARLFVAKHAGQVIAALFFATFNRRAYSVFSGSTDIGYRVGAQSGLFWTAVETFKAEEFRELNRGGVPVSAARETDPLHGIYLFKLRLGTTPSVCHSGEKVLSPVRDRLVQLCHRVKKPRGAA